MKAVRILLCAALLLTGSLWLADSALAKPAYCDCGYCAQATQWSSCTDPITQNVYNYHDWCYYNCLNEPAFLETNPESSQALSTDEACDAAAAPAELPTEIDPQPQPSSP